MVLFSKILEQSQLDNTWGGQCSTPGNSWGGCGPPRLGTWGLTAAAGAGNKPGFVPASSWREREAGRQESNADRLASHTGCKIQGYISMYWTGGCSTCLSAQSQRLLGSRESGNVKSTFLPLNPGYLAASAAESTSLENKLSSPG